MHRGDALAQRQCRVIRAARAGKVRATTFVVRANPSAFQVGAWDPAKKSLPITLHGCLACNQPVDVGGKKLYLDARPTGGAAPPAAGAVIHQSGRVFADQAAAEAWKKDVVPRLRVELVVRLPDGDPVWHRGGRDGVGVTVLGYRVYDPCDGGIVCASPTATRPAPDPKACGKTVEAGPADGGDGGGDAPKGRSRPARAVDDPAGDGAGGGRHPEVPRHLWRGRHREAAHDDHRRRQPGGARAARRLRPHADRRLHHQRGQGRHVPPSHKSRTTITYPIMLR